jgi:prepilin-type processing-associated H-X9-DG protein
MFVRASMSRGRSAVTLVEVLVVFGIIAVLLGLTLAGAQKARGSAARLQCANNLRQLAIAAHAYSGDHGTLPAGCGYPDKRYREIDVVPVSWETALLPYLEQVSLGQLAEEAYRLDHSGESPLHNSIRMTSLHVLLCPTEARTLGGSQETAEWALTSYRGVAGTGLKHDDGVLQPRLAIRLTDITDGTSSTLMIGERPAGPNGLEGAWYAGWGTGCVCQLAQLLPVTDEPSLPFEARGCPVVGIVFRPGRIDNPCDVGHYWSYHSGGANFAFADGSVRFVSYAISDILPELATRDGGEVVAIPD